MHKKSGSACWPSLLLFCWKIKMDESSCVSIICPLHDRFLIPTCPQWGSRFLPLHSLPSLCFVIFNLATFIFSYKSTKINYKTKINLTKIDTILISTANYRKWRFFSMPIWSKIQCFSNMRKFTKQLFQILMLILFEMYCVNANCYSIIKNMNLK